jgi:hypothetical protein
LDSESAILLLLTFVDALSFLADLAAIGVFATSSIFRTLSSTDDDVFCRINKTAMKSVIVANNKYTLVFFLFILFIYLLSYGRGIAKGGGGAGSAGGGLIFH